MKVLETNLPGVKLLEPKVFGDRRGFFLENYNMSVFHEHGIEDAFLQDNHSLSKEAGVLRGLHYQLNPKAQSKLVRIITGAVYDVVVDIREGSPTYKEWQGFILSEHNQRMLYVPEGFAHGFCTLTENTNVCYKVNDYYSPEHDRGIRWDDPELLIDWPVSEPILSEKDRQQPLLREADYHFSYDVEGGVVR
ncbi:UNVERIFIED_CONTAM: dTDP-4-dehydrorhamnose 3,5-epimerase [Halobacillus marinus]